MIRALKSQGITRQMTEELFQKYMLHIQVNHSMLQELLKRVKWQRHKYGGISECKKPSIHVKKRKTKLQQIMRLAVALWPDLICGFQHVYA